MSESNLHKLSGLGQSVWIDSLSREMLETGEHARQMEADAVVGVTSHPTISEPRHRTFMSSCSTPWWAEYASWQIAARMPRILHAATEAPTPEPQTKTARSASPWRIALPTAFAMSG